MMIPRDVAVHDHATLRRSSRSRTGLQMAIFRRLALGRIAAAAMRNGPYDPVIWSQLPLKPPSLNSHW